MTDNPWAEPRGILPPAHEAFPKVAITGHRPKAMTPAQLGWAHVAIARATWRLRSTYGAQCAISGMALGADTIFAVSALACGMDLHAYIPFEAQPDVWPEADRQLWHHLRARAAREVLVGGIEYEVRMLHARNDAMIQDADLVVALLRSDATKGGTFSAVKKTAQAGKPMLMLDPVAQTTSRVGW
ncbi:hypothetical protein [Nocardioides sp. InS609-2]|uniref:hypothetical protein n=1 Tax=Nocardioides sp. InS609-2 TaxID=2760705 RepID=UPI0020BE4481|nr:hypothetical protein [Nocardioides sp. InS609-2]